MKSGKIFVVSGPSAAGKSTIVAKALERFSKETPIERVVTYTSRPPRSDEKNGVDYIFISGPEFSKKEKDGFFLETAEYVKHRYGSPKVTDDAIKQGKSFVYVVEIAGAKEIKKAYRDAPMIWIEAPSLDILKKRLGRRGAVTEGEFERRMVQAELDMAEARKGRLFDYFLVNDVFEQSVEEFILLLKKSY